MVSRPERRFCKCGCGEMVRAGNTWISGHNLCKGAYAKKQIQQSKMCKCGCGELAKPGNIWIRGHNPVPKITASEETRKRMSDSHKGKRLPQETKDKIGSSV